jgi:hypothetical protein
MRIAPTANLGVPQVYSRGNTWKHPTKTMDSGGLIRQIAKGYSRGNTWKPRLKLWTLEDNSAK